MINNPPGWGVNFVTSLYRSARPFPGDMPRVGVRPRVQRIGFADLRWALQRGLEDFAAARTDVMTLCVFYPLVGLVLARLASGNNLLPLIFPLISGFALIGPVAAVGLNEMSRLREAGQPTSWADPFGILRSPAIGGIALLGGILLLLFLFWLYASNGVYELTLGPKPPASAGDFLHDVFFTPAGWTMAAFGIGLGFIFAVVAFLISAVSFPLLLDRHVPLDVAIRTSVRVVTKNPLTMAGWGLIIAAGLVIGSIPALLGLIVVLPVLGHATWHLYRRAVA